MKDKAWVHVRQDFDKMSTVGLANKVQTTFKKNIICKSWVREFLGNQECFFFSLQGQFLCGKMRCRKCKNNAKEHETQRYQKNFRKCFVELYTFHWRQCQQI